MCSLLCGYIPCLTGRYFYGIGIGIGMAAVSFIDIKIFQQNRIFLVNDFTGLHGDSAVCSCIGLESKIAVRFKTGIHYVIISGVTVSFSLQLYTKRDCTAVSADVCLVADRC